MSTPGRPKCKYRSAQHEGTPVSIDAQGRCCASTLPTRSVGRCSKNSRCWSGRWSRITRGPISRMRRSEPAARCIATSPAWNGERLIIKPSGRGFGHGAAHQADEARQGLDSREPLAQLRIRRQAHAAFGCVCGVAVQRNDRRSSGLLAPGRPAPRGAVPSARTAAPPRHAGPDPPAG